LQTLKFSVFVMMMNAEPTMPSYSYVQSFNATYRRVNKARQRNLRCFPGHSPTGHVGSGFCGCPVIVHVAQTSTSKDAVYYGELALALAPARTSIGETSRLMLSGTRRGNAVVFNDDMLAWQYDWISNSSTCRSQHVFRMYVVEGGEITAVRDSLSFQISSFRYKNVDEELGMVSPSDPLRVLIRAIRERVHAVDTSAWNNTEVEDEEEVNGEDDSMGVIDAASFGKADGCELMVDDDTEDRLLEIESLDALLERCAHFLAKRFSAWRDLVALKVDVEALLAEEGRTLGNVADRLQALFFGPSPTPPTATQQLQQASGNPLLQIARQLALTLIPRGCHLFHELPAANSPSAFAGFYRRPEVYDVYIDELKVLEGGWSHVDMSLVTSAPFVWFACVSPNLVAMMHCGNKGWGAAGLYKLNVVNHPPDYRPLEFKGGSTKLVCPFAFDAGLVMVIFGVIEGALVQVFARNEHGALVVKTAVVRYRQHGTPGGLQAEFKEIREFVFEPAALP
jgi:hypothetical protein